MQYNPLYTNPITLHGITSLGSNPKPQTLVFRCSRRLRPSSCTAGAPGRNNAHPARPLSPAGSGPPLPRLTAPPPTGPLSPSHTCVQVLKRREKG